jgi:pimeloyl-ACP methyl ester carboxylesterase
MDDVRAVMDAVGSERAALFGISEGGPMSLLFAATYPERTIALTLFDSYALFPTAVMAPERLAGFLQEVEELWGTGKLVPRFAPSLADDAAFRSSWARFERLGASPSAVNTLMRMNSEIDIRGVLPAIHVPTLIMHRAGDARVNVAAGRYLAQHIDGARYVELPGNDHLFCAGQSQRIVDEIEEFLTGLKSCLMTWAESRFRDLVAGSGLYFENRGVHALKGLADGARIYAAEASASESPQI